MELNEPASPPEGAARTRYALWLEWGARAGFVLMVAGFLAYAAGLVQPHVPLERLPELWLLPAAEYREATGIAAGWGWAALAHRGDLMNLVPIAWLASGSIACLAAIIPIFVARRWWPFVTICALEIAVITLAASGLLASAH